MAEPLKKPKGVYSMNEQETEVKLTEKEIQEIIEEETRYYIREGANAGVYD